jgi:hypothetical protein
VLLASAIGVLLMAALYVAMDVQLKHVQAGRDVVEQSLLTRALLTRMGNDISSSLGPVAPNRSSSSTNSSATTGTTGSTSTTGSTASTGSTSTSGTTSGAGSSSGTSSSSSSNSSSTGPVQFNLGVQGDANRLTIYVSRVPREISWTNDATANSNGQPLVSDLRRITYWLAGGTSDSAGLARQEVKVATSDDALNSMPPDIPDELSFVVAEEIKSLEFQYFDGSTWQSSWDGTTPGSDGKTPIGPPLAIQIKVGVAARNAGPDNLKYYRHVVAIPTANGATSNSQQSMAGQ